MGGKTDALMHACAQSATRATQALASVDGPFNAFNGAVSRLEAMLDPDSLKGDLSAKDKADVLQQMIERVVTERTFTRGSFDRIGPALAQAEKNAKELAAKVKAKNFLDHFKDQKSLAAAKARLKETETAVAEGRKDQSSREGRITKLEAKAEAEIDRVSLLVKALKRAPGVDRGVESIVEDLQTYVGRAQACGTALGKIAAAIKTKESLLASMQKQAGSKNRPTSEECAALVAGAERQLREVDSFFEQIVKLFDVLYHDMKGIEERGAKSDPKVKAAYAKANAARDAFSKGQVAAETRLYAVRHGFQELYRDMRVGATLDDGGYLAEAEKAYETLRQLVMNIQMGASKAAFEGGIELCTETKTTITPWLKNPRLLGDAERDRLREIATDLENHALVVDKEHAQVGRRLDEAAGIAKRFRQETAIQDEFAAAKTQVAECRRLHDAFQKALPPLVKAVAKLQQL